MTTPNTFWRSKLTRFVCTIAGVIGLLFGVIVLDGIRRSAPREYGIGEWCILLLMVALVPVAFAAVGALIAWLIRIFLRE
jgi:hypothetical protein